MVTELGLEKDWKNANVKIETNDYYLQVLRKKRTKNFRTLGFYDRNFTILNLTYFSDHVLRLHPFIELFSRYITQFYSHRF